MASVVDQDVANAGRGTWICDFVIVTIRRRVTSRLNVVDLERMIFAVFLFSASKIYITPT